MKHTRKISIALVIMMVLMMALAVIPASAATPETLYLTPNANWKVDNARFAAYFFGNGETWVSMTDSDGDGVYEVTVPTDKTYPSVIFCRMNPSASANNWNNKWNQTADLTIPTSGANHYTVTEGTWDKGGGTWSTLDSTCAHDNKSAEATCTTAQTCLDCGDPIVSALGHKYVNNVCTRTNCGIRAIWTVAGSQALCGTNWDPTDAANDMTYDEETGNYVKVYENVAAGTYAFKCVRDHDAGYGAAYPASDYSLTVAEDGSTVKITLSGTTVTASAALPHVCDYTIPATCTSGAKCECGEVDPTSSPVEHTYVDGLCSVCGGIDLSNTVTFYFQNDWLWTDLYVHYWYNGGATEWPGIALVDPVGENEAGNKIYEITMPVGVTGFLVHGLDNGVEAKTGDITTVPHACQCYYMNWNETDGNHVESYDYHVNGEGVVTDPTCTAGGYTTYTCTVCGAESKGDETEAIAHTYDEFNGVVGEDNVPFAQYVCSCGATVNKEVVTFKGGSVRYKDGATVAELAIRFGYQIDPNVIQYVTSWYWDYEAADGDDVVSGTKYGEAMTEAGVTNLVFTNVPTKRIDGTFSLKLTMVLTVDGVEYTFVDNVQSRVIIDVLNSIIEAGDPAKDYAQSVIEAFNALSNDEVVATPVEDEEENA